MNIQDYINTLLDEDTSLAEQVELIEALNKLRFEADALTALAQALRERCEAVTGLPAETVDIVGTGGDGFDTLNFSTLASLVVAAAGYPVAKHGGKSSTSRCGSFDLLQQLDIRIPETVEQAQHAFATEGMVFLFAPHFHPLMQRVGAARKVFAERGEKTIFNCIGPLIHPARVRRMVVGVYDPQLLEPYAQALLALGIDYAYIFHGDGLDELTLTGPTQAIRIEGGKPIRETITPGQLGLGQCAVIELTGGEPMQNRRESEQLLRGEFHGPKRDMVIANAAAGIRVASGFGITWDEAMAIARKCLNEGAVMQLLSSSGLK